jgi:hypothetical protein
MLEFAPFQLDTVNQCLWRRRDGPDDKRILLPPTGFAVLRYLVEHAGRLQAARRAPGDDAFDLAWREGRSMALDEAIDYALESCDVRGTCSHGFDRSAGTPSLRRLRAAARQA